MLTKEQYEPLDPETLDILRQTLDIDLNKWAIENGIQAKINVEVTNQTRVHGPFVFSSQDEQIKGILKNLSYHVNQFIMVDRQIGFFNDNCDKTFKKFQGPSSLSEKAYNALIFVFRAFFRTFDSIITQSKKALGDKDAKLMAESGTPLANKLGKHNVFEYASQYNKSSGKLKENLKTTLQSLEEKNEDSSNTNKPK